MENEYEYVDTTYQTANSQAQESSQRSGSGVAGMVLGIISLVATFFGFGGLITLATSVIGLILSIGARKKCKSDGYALTGVITSSIALALSVISLIILAVIIGLWLFLVIIALLPALAML
jgi:hypothetical protein